MKANRPDEDQQCAAPHQQTGRDGDPRQFHSLHTPCRTQATMASLPNCLTLLPNATIWTFNIQKKVKKNLGLRSKSSL
jgi:hypothetical protein